jgi:signal peptidase II
MRAVHPIAFYATAALIFASDQLAKTMVSRQVAWEQSTPVPIPGLSAVLNITLTHNPGGAWGLGQHRNAAFVLLACVAAVALVFAFHRMARLPLLVGTALSLALGGALGNLVDRLRFGYVVDFFELHLQRHQFPIFNIADSAITLGIVMLLIHFVRPGLDDPAIAGAREPAEERTPPSPSESG